MKHSWWVGLIVSAGCAHVAAQVTVSSNGLPLYSQQITVPPGVGKIAPQLGLSYGGAGVNGPLGHAWSLQGLSSITRCPADRIVDGVTTPVAFSSSDRLCLDGQRLVRSDAAGAAQTSSDDAIGSNTVREFRTERDSYSRVRAYGFASAASGNSGPQYVKVWTKEGLLYEYGQTPAVSAANLTLVMAQGKSVAMAWPLARVSDTSGNYMEFVYRQQTAAWGSGAGAPSAGMEWNISEIRYTGNAGVKPRAPNNKVVFDYVTKTDLASAPRDGLETYQAGSKNISTLRLGRIRSFVGTDLPQPVLVRSMLFEYEQSPVTGRTRLKRDRECFGESTTTPGTQGGKCTSWNSFTYSNNGGAALAPSSVFNLHAAQLVDPSGSFGIYVADFNGDGRADILRWSADFNVAPHQLYLGAGDGAFSLGALNLNNLLNTPDGCFFTMVADMNGDGLPDLVRVMSQKKVTDGTTCPYGGTDNGHVFFNDGKGNFSPVALTVTASGATANLILTRITSKSTSKTWCLSDTLAARRGRATASAATPPASPNAPPPCTNQEFTQGVTAGATFYLFDVNGDGRLDVITSTLPAWAAPDPAVDPSLPSQLCLAGTVCTHVYINQGNGNFAEQASPTLNGNTLYSAPGVITNLQGPKHISDVNGDGLADLVSVGMNGSAGNWISKGNGDFTQVSNTKICDRPIDANGDGRADCLMPNGDNVAASALSISTGAGSFTTSTFNLNVAGSELVPPTAPLTYGFGHIVADFNGDGREDIFRWHDGPNLNKLFLSNGDGSFRDATSESGLLNVPMKNSTGMFDMVQADFTGRGIGDWLRVSSAPNGNTPNELFLRSNSVVGSAPANPDLLLTVTNSMGLVSRISYSSMVNSASNRYVSDRGTTSAAVYPLIDVANAAPLVTTVETDSGTSGGTVRAEYAYRGFKASINGQGVTGFRNVRIQTPGADASTLLTRGEEHLMVQPYVGATRWSDLRKSDLVGYDSASILSKTANIYCDISSSGAASATETAPCPVDHNAVKILRSYVRKVTQTGTDLGGNALPTVTTVNTYNEWGEPTTISETTSGSFAGATRNYGKTTVRGFDPINIDADNWIVARMNSITVNRTTPDLQLVPSAGTAPNASATTGAGL